MCVSLSWLLWKKMVQRDTVQEVVVVHQGETPTQPQIHFPYSIYGTDLTIEALSFYEGPYLEDGTYEEVCDVAALVVHNTGAQTLSKVSITVQTEKEALLFEGNWLLPGKTCVLLEKNKSIYANETVRHCEGISRVTAFENLLDGQVAVNEESIDRLKVTNLSENSLSHLRIVYKNYLTQTDMYMGGITYEIGIDGLAPGQCYTLTPPYYVKDYSKVIFAYTVQNNE